MAESLIVGSADLIDKRRIRIKGEEFEVELFYSPQNLPEKLQDELADRIGGRLISGKPCLEITKNNAAFSIENEDYSVIGFAKNVKNIRPMSDDEASGTLQLYKWCNDDSPPELWLNDLCRITSLKGKDKPETSPLQALLKVFESVARVAKLKYMYLMVENKEPERTILPEVYKKYGFRITTCCSLTDDDSLVMRKDLRKRRKTRKRTHKRHRP